MTGQDEVTYLLYCQIVYWHAEQVVIGITSGVVNGVLAWGSSQCLHIYTSGISSLKQKCACSSSPKHGQWLARTGIVCRFEQAHSAINAINALSCQLSKGTVDQHNVLLAACQA